MQSFLDGAVLNKVQPKFLKVRKKKKTMLQESGLSLRHQMEGYREGQFHIFGAQVIQRLARLA